MHTVALAPIGPAQLLRRVDDCDVIYIPWPMTPPTTAPPTAPTAPTPAPIMVHPTRPNSTVTTTAFTTKFLYLVHLEYFRVKHQAPRNYLPGGLLVVVLLCFVHTKFLGAA